MFTPEDRSEEHKMIADTARQFISREILPYRKELEAGNFPLVAEKIRKAGVGIINQSKKH
ncbi:acyl-CoA dehydrogenase family protein [Halobacillus shinanisalinarum]|uniref:acyl-CoA dehydrogenase family protein n=1 Tax=Halobacillus shinanisalinarum TaxID=2932258 RepID=UPI0037C10FD9